MRKAEVGFLVDCPAEAKSRVAGSSLICLRADRPPLANTRFDWAAIPFLGFPYLLKESL